MHKNRKRGVFTGIAVPLEKERHEKPWDFSWFETMRWLEANNPSFPRFGTAVSPSDEIVRISQKPTLSFPSTELSTFYRDNRGRVRIEQVSFGLFGPNGPMPLNFTEFAREREEYDDDHVLRVFLDVFHHRFSMLFYRAWSSAQATNNLDRPDKDRFSCYIGSLMGYGEPAFNGQDSVPDHAKRYMAGHFVRMTRNPEGLVSILQDYFGCPFSIKEWMPSWLPIDDKERTSLGLKTPAGQLARGAICGKSVLDHRHRFRICIGPLKLSEYIAFLPGRPHFKQLRDWVRNYVGYEFSWDIQMILRHDEVLPVRLGSEMCMLGWTNWVKPPPTIGDRGDLILEGDMRYH
ncbi:MAG: type VI secretion system baseplate subunit TssG [Oscillospiraceae bacterium]|nr:type VI secretion system baseplate subunit TssG [Oscillospiraceae bacterium]